MSTNQNKLIQNNTENALILDRANLEQIELTTEGRYLRKIRSFALRAGRLSQLQQDAINNYWADYGLEYQHSTYNFQQIFNNNHPVVVEIGFGMGHSIVAMAEQNPNINYIGIEVHTPGIGTCINNAVLKNIKNLRIIYHDAIEVLQNSIDEQSILGLQLFFPDPWQKTKHHKRRIVQPAFIDLAVQKLQPDGFIHMATDWQNYAEHMLKTVKGNAYLSNLSITHDYISRPESRPLTKFEQRGKLLGHSVWDIYFVKNK